MSTLGIGDGTRAVVLHEIGFEIRAKPGDVVSVQIVHIRIVAARVRRLDPVVLKIVVHKLRCGSVVCIYETLPGDVVHGSPATVGNRAGARARGEVVFIDGCCDGGCCRQGSGDRHDGGGGSVDHVHDHSFLSH